MTNYKYLQYSKLSIYRYHIRLYAKYIYGVTILVVILLFSVHLNQSSDIKMMKMSHLSSRSHNTENATNLCHKLAIIIPFKGDLPKYTQHFLKSANHSNVQFYFISTDNRTLINNDYPNIHQIYLKSSFHTYAAHKLCKLYKCDKMEFSKIENLIENRINNENYAISELRPMFNYIFRAYLTQFEYVGWSDVDIIWSNPNLLFPYLNADIVTIPMIIKIYYI
eukprot:NODE_362_length_8790_cov_0.566678.p5 type:complete len:222 gc:universal NODE_362_length_8790_cov_0.566678:8071-7406(-)